METGKINHESDFKLPVEPKEIPNLSASPFKLVFYTRKSVNKYVASYDGTKYTNCYPTSDGGLVVVFDNHNLGCGTMWCDVHLPLPDEDFKDGICNYRSTEPTGVLLHKGATDDVRGLKMDVFPFFLQGADGKSAYDLWLDQGNEGTVEEFLASLSFPNDPVLDEELYYDNGSGEVVPVKHPDLATQPNILPYKLAGNYVYEQLISIPNDIKFSTSNGYVKFFIDAPKWEIEKPSVLKATLMSSNVASVNEPQMCMPCIVSNAGDSLSVYVSDVLLAEKGSLKDLWLLLEYSSFDARGYYYERSNEVVAEKGPTESKYNLYINVEDGYTWEINGKQYNTGLHKLSDEEVTHIITTSNILGRITSALDDRCGYMKATLEGYTETRDARVSWSKNIVTGLWSFGLVYFYETYSGIYSLSYHLPMAAEAIANGEKVILELTNTY